MDAQKNATSGEGRRKRRQYLHFGQLLFLLPHAEDRPKQSNLSTQSNENEEKANNSQEEESVLPRNDRHKKRNTISYEESLLQILQQKKIEDIDVDEENCFLLSLLPYFWQFNDEQICVSGGNSQNYATRQTATKFGYVFILLLIFLFKCKHVPPNTSHFATNPVNP